MKPFAALALALAACAAPRIEGSGARVQVGLPYGPRVAEIVRDVEPKIVEILGTRWPWEYRVTLEQEAEGSVAWMRAWDRRVVLGPLSLSEDELPLALAHELAHVHMRAPWTDLPRVLQEGVAIWVSLLVLERTEEFGGPTPPRQLCLDVFTLPYSEFLDADAERENELRYAATWIAAGFMSGVQPRRGPNSWPNKKTPVRLTPAGRPESD